MKKTILTAITALSVFLFTGSVIAGDVSSLRGHALADPAKKPAKMKRIDQAGGFERSFKLKPPMVPHEVDKYPVTIKNNGCMKCHSKATHEKEKAPMVGESHFKDRDGKVLPKLSSRRYFCNQCHAPQLDTAPLIANQFEGAK